MINYYNYPAAKDTALSEHFAVGEFVTASDYGGSYPSEIPIDTDLINILEDIFDHFDCDCAIISSGYRTPECDIAVGGSGSGYHTYGMAADVSFYKNGQQLNSRLIACYAQDIGVKGIGYCCGGAELWTHLDSRSEGRWYGDERDYSTCDDFYSYTGTSKSEVYGDGDYSDNNQTPADDSADVRTVQSWLYENYAVDVEIDGIYGSQTKSALVGALQIELNKKGSGLWVDGIFGKCTKAAVVNLSEGDSGNLVYILQGLLLCNGYGAGGFDGIFGSGTESAVLSYQYKNALTPDGIAGQETFESLCG